MCATPPAEPLPEELVRQVLLHANDETVRACLRISKAVFDISASILYREAAVDYNFSDTSILFRSRRQYESGSDSENPLSPYAERRLTHVRTLVVYDHPVSACRSSLTRRLASSLSKLQTLRVYGSCRGQDGPQGQETRDVCSFLSGSCRRVVLDGMGLEINESDMVRPADGSPQILTLHLDASYLIVGVPETLLEHLAKTMSDRLTVRILITDVTGSSWNTCVNGSRRSSTFTSQGLRIAIQDVMSRCKVPIELYNLSTFAWKKNGSRTSESMSADVCDHFDEERTSSSPHPPSIKFKTCEDFLCEGDFEELSTQEWNAIKADAERLERGTSRKPKEGWILMDGTWEGVPYTRGRIEETEKTHGTSPDAES